MRDGHDVLVREAGYPSARVEAGLRERLAADEWPHGAQLPAIAELAEQYGVARATVRKALERLEAEGLVRVVPYWGTFRADE